MITVVGGTGRLGRQVVAELLSRGKAVRAVSRHAASDATLEGDTRLAGAELVVADMARPEQARAVVEGSTHVVAAMTGMDRRRGAGPRAVDRDAAIILTDAAAAAGWHLILLSVVGASPDSPLELFRMKWLAETHLRATDLPCTIVRATAFAELWSEILVSSARRDGRAMVLGPARNPMNFAPVADVAAAVVRATEDSSMVGQGIEVCGAKNLSLSQLATELTWKQPRHLPTLAVRALGRAAQPFAPGVARIARQAVALEHGDLTHEPTALGAQ